MTNLQYGWHQADFLKCSNRCIKGIKVKLDRENLAKLCEDGYWRLSSEGRIWFQEAEKEDRSSQVLEGHDVILNTGRRLKFVGMSHCCYTFTSILQARCWTILMMPWS